MRKFAAIFVATSLVCVPEYGLPSYWCLSCFHIWASSLLTSEFKMAENKDGKGGLDVGFFIMIGLFPDTDGWMVIALLK